MRILVPVCVGLAAISCATAAVLWSERHSDRQLIQDLRTQLSEAKSALAAKPAAMAAITSTEVAPQQAAAVQIAGAAPASAPAKITREEALAALSADSVKRQKTLMADPEYRKALLAQARSDIQQHYVGLAVELGMTDVEVNALFDVLAEAQVKAMTSMTSLASGAQPDAAASAEMQRQMKDEAQRVKDQITAMLGPQRTAQFEEYDRIQPSRTRVNSLTNLLGRSGQALTNPQKRQLTAVMVAEQNRMEAEAKALRDAGKTETRSQADIQAEANRRILEQVPSFLSAQQVQLVRGRFQERATIDRASDRVQQREREVLQEPSN
jgi:hypothetical protein